MERPKGERERGITLLLAIMVISVILSIGLNITSLATKELSFMRLTSDSVRAHYSAESALECALYWMFQGTQYFSDSVETIYCNNEDIELDDPDTWVVSLGNAGQYASVEVQKTSADPSDRNFKLVSEGYNQDPTAGLDPSLIQQEVGAVSLDGCSFDAQNVDVNNSASPATSIGSTNLQLTLDEAYNPDWMGRNNYIEASSSNTGYQTWKVGNSSGNVRVTLEVTPLESAAAFSNTFGYYVNNPDSPYTSWSQIKADNAFIPIFANKTPNVWNAPTLTPNPDASLDGWQTFTINAGEDEVIAFGIHSSSTNVDTFRSTEIAINGLVSTQAHLKIGGLCIAPTGGSTANGTDLMLETCGSGNHQKWTQDGLVWRNIANVGKAIDMDLGNLSTVQVWDYWSGNNYNQRWTVTEIGTTGTYQFLTNHASGKCISRSGATGIAMAVCDGSADQQIEIEELGTFGYQYALTYDVPLPVEVDVPEYVLAIEDLTLSGANADYDDMVVTVKVLSCISELNRY